MVKLAMTPRVGAGAPVDALLFESRLNFEIVKRGIAATVAVVVASRLLPQLSMKCYHLEERGGSKAAVRYIAAARTANSFVFRTDVKS